MGSGEWEVGREEWGVGICNRGVHCVRCGYIPILNAKAQQAFTGKSFAPH